jgi:hypothetical protein
MVSFSRTKRCLSKSSARLNSSITIPLPVRFILHAENLFLVKSYHFFHCTLGRCICNETLRQRQLKFHSVEARFAFRVILRREREFSYKYKLIAPELRLHSFTKRLHIIEEYYLLGYHAV